MFFVNLNIIKLGWDGKACSNLEDGFKPLEEFKTKEEAKRFFDDYDFEWDYNEAVREQGYGTIVAILSVEDEDGEVLYKKEKESEPDENAIRVWEIRDGWNYDRVLDTFDNEQEAVKAFDNYHVNEGGIALYEVRKYPNVDDREELYGIREADEDGQEE